MKLRKLRLHFASLAALLIGIAGLGTVALAAPANAATGCSVAYAIQSDWGAGFVVNITITNLGSPITAWTLGLYLPGNQTLSNGWNGNWTQSGKTVTVTNASYNGSLATGGTAVPGAQFAYSGTNVNPTSFTLNGVTCTGQTTSTGSIVVSPTAQNITQGKTGTVGVSLSAAPTANVTVSTAFTSGNSGDSVTAGSSLTFTPTNFATPQTVTVTANATGTGATTFTSSATGYPSVTFTATEVAGQHRNPDHRLESHDADHHSGRHRHGRDIAVVRAELERHGDRRQGIREHRTVGVRRRSLTFTPTNFSDRAERDDHGRQPPTRAWPRSTRAPPG